MSAKIRLFYIHIDKSFVFDESFRGVNKESGQIKYNQAGTSSLLKVISAISSRLPTAQSIPFLFMYWILQIRTVWRWCQVTALR